MKEIKKIITALLCLIVLSNILYAQPDNFPGCGTTTEVPQIVSSPYKPTKTNGSTVEKLNILIVHICFADDNNPPLLNDFWPAHQMPISPSGNIPILAPEKITGGNFMDRYPDYTISDYFCEMSMGQLDVVGTCVLIDLPQPYTSEYFKNNNFTRATLNKFILQNYVDPIDEANFTNFDNWSYINGQWVYEPDGTVDMIVMNYRYIPNDPSGNIWFWEGHGSASGEASLGQGQWVTNLILDGKTINNNPMSYSGSGVTALGQRLNYSGVSHIIEHEIAHHFFVNYLNAQGDPIHSTNGLMVGVDAAAYNMSPFERTREILGWDINPTVVTTTNTYNLADYVKTGQMLKILIPGTTYEYFWISNHQKISLYDGISRGGKQCYEMNSGRQDPYCQYGKGLFIYHESGPNCTYNYGKTFDIEQADGKWNWVVDRWVQYYDPQYNICIPLFEHQSPNGGNPNTGKAEYLQEIMFISDPETCFPWGPWTFSQGVSDNPCSESPGDYFVTLDNSGDGLDGFNVGYDEIFSPYSNPNTNSCQNLGASLTINLLSEDENGNINVKIYFDDNLALNELPPAKPKNLKGLREPVNQYSVQFYPKIMWDKNKEPDFESGGSYKIYRGFSTVCNPDLEPQYIHIGTVSPLTPEYIDYTVRLFPSGGGSRQCEREFQSYSYKVQAVDYTNKPSLQSDRVIINGYLDPCAPEDRPNYSNNEIINKFNFFNYPNPFNPSTEIKFDLPQNTYVTLRVYNAVGQVVAELINDEFRNAGSYSVSFDGSKLASGIYFYSIEAGVYKDVKKMVLIK